MPGGTLAPARLAQRYAEDVIANIQYRTMIRKDRLPAVDAWLAKNDG